MPINGSSAPSRTLTRPPWMKDSATANKPTWAAKRTDTNDGGSSSTSGSDAKGDTPPRRPSKVTITPKENGTPKKEVKLQSREIKVPVMTERKQAIPVLTRRDDRSSSMSSRSPSIASTDKSRSPSVPVKKESSPESDELDSSEYDEVTVTESEEEEEEDEIERPVKFVPLRKVTKQEKEKKEKSATPEPEFAKPALRKVEKQPSFDKTKREVSPEHKFVKPTLRKVKRDPSKKEIPKERLPQVELKRAPPKEERELRREPTIPSIQEIKQENIKKIPPPPPPPPPKGLQPPPGFAKKEVSSTAKQRIEQLKKRARRRPDWSDMMKEVEEGKKLRHVDCNDRSHPIIHTKSVTKVQGQFMFETEADQKDTKLDALLKEIQGGVKLKPVKTNDRSKPVLAGLRKFRRQMTLEEQLQKSESKINLDAMPPSVIDDEEVEDETDDVDKLRDDLQSTKQLLALELRNKEAQERENKRLLSRIQNLEAELEMARANQGVSNGAVTKAFTDDDPLVKALKKEADESQRQSKMLERKYSEAAEKLDIAKAELEEQKKLIAKFMAQCGGWERFSELYSEANNEDDFDDDETGGPPVSQETARRLSENQTKESSPEPTFSESEDDDDEDDPEKRRQKALRKLMREVKLLRFRLNKYKEKEQSAKQERQTLKEQMKTYQLDLKSEKKKYKKLHKEVEKMASLMNAAEEDEDDEDKPEKPEDEEKEESEEESESDESESESEASDNEWSESENEDAPDSKKKKNLDPRVKRHENRLGALKKGNLLLEANVIRLKDEINRTREQSGSLQFDLDSVIAELGL